MGSTLCVFAVGACAIYFPFACVAILFYLVMRKDKWCSAPVKHTAHLYLLCSCSWVCMLSDQLLTNGIILYNIPLSFFFTAFNLAGTNIWHWTFVQCTEQTKVSLQKVVWIFNRTSGSWTSTVLNDFWWLTEREKPNNSYQSWYFIILAIPKLREFC